MDDKNSEKIGHECLRARVGKRGGGGIQGKTLPFLAPLLQPLKSHNYLTRTAFSPLQRFSNSEISGETTCAR